MLLLLLLPLFCSVKAASLRALVTSSPSLTALVYGTLDSETGQFRRTADWSAFGASIGGHVWAAGPGGTTAVVTLFLNQDVNWVYLFDAQGRPLHNFSSPLVFCTLEYSPAAQAFMTVTIVNKAMNAAQLGWAPPFVTPRVGFDSRFYQQELGVSAMDHSSSTLYLFATSDSSQQTFLFAVSAASFSILRQMPCSIAPLATEYYNGTLLALVQGARLFSAVFCSSHFFFFSAAWNATTGAVWLEVHQVQAATGSSSLLAALSPGWPATLSASAVGADGTFFLGLGNAGDPPSVWRVASVSPSGAVTYSEPFLTPVLSLLPE